MRILLANLVLSGLALSSPAFAQPMPGAELVGAWSGQRPGQAGMDHVTTAYQPDGSYVSAMQLPNGTIERIWGKFKVTPLPAQQMRVDFRVDGVLPRQICAQAPGFPMNCRPNVIQNTITSVITPKSASSFEVNGMTMMRDSAPYLLQQRIPEQLVMAVAAPAAPRITQPTMPTLHPYETPHGPGLAIAGANHQMAQEFINGNMRGCYKGNDGRLYGCQQ